MTQYELGIADLIRKTVIPTMLNRKNIILITRSLNSLVNSASRFPITTLSNLFQIVVSDFLDLTLKQFLFLIKFPHILACSLIKAIVLMLLSRSFPEVS
jgi:hypothetical protein